MIDEQHEKQNSTDSPPKCSVVLTGKREADRDLKNECTDSKGPQNIIDPFLINPDVKEVEDIVHTIENAVYRIIDNNFDHLANHSSNTLGMRVKDSLILKAKLTDKKEVPFNGLKTSLACRLIIDDDLRIRFLPQVESLAPGSDSEILSTKRKKSVSLAEEVKVFNRIENEFFAEDEVGFCNELMDNHSEKIMDQEKDATESKDRMYGCIPQKSSTSPGCESSLLNYLNTVKLTGKNSAVSQDQEIEMEETTRKDSQKSQSRASSKDLIKKFDNAAENPMILSFPQLLSNDGGELQEIQTTECSARSGPLGAQSMTIASVSEENEPIMSLVETKSRPSSSRLDQSLVFGNENTQLESRVDETIEISKDDEAAINESRKSSYTIDDLDADEVYRMKKLSNADKAASENVSEENKKIIQIKILMNEFLSSLKKPNGDKSKAEDQMSPDPESTELFEDAFQEPATAIGRSQPILEINKTLEYKISEKGILGVNPSDEEFSLKKNDNDSCNNISNTEKTVKLVNDDTMIEKSHSESSKINDQLSADSGFPGIRRNSEIDAKDVTEMSDKSETNRVETNNSMKFPNDEQLEGLKLGIEEIDMNSTSDTKTTSSGKDPLSMETLTKVSLKANNLSKQSSRTDSSTDHQSSNDLSLKQTWSTVSREGSKSSRKSTRIDITDRIRPGPNNLTVETFPVSAKDKGTLNHIDSVHVKEPELIITLEAEGSGGNDLENSTGAPGVISVLRKTSSLNEPLKESRKNAKSKEKNTVNGEEVFSITVHKAESLTVACLATPAAAVDQQLGEKTSIEEKVESDSTLMENERDKEDSSDSVAPDKDEPLNLFSNLKSIFKSLNKSQSEKRSVTSIGDLENSNTVKKSSETEVNKVEFQLIRSTKSLQDDRKHDRRTTGHKLFDGPFDAEDLVQQSCQATTHNDFEEIKNKDKSDDIAVANGIENYSDKSVVKSDSQKFLTDEENVYEETAKVSDRRMKSRKDRKSDENAKKFAISLSRIFSNSLRRKNGEKESRATLDSQSSVEDHFEIPKIPLPSSDDSNSQQKVCKIRTQKLDATEDNREELVAIKSLDSMQDSFTAYKESIVKSSSKYSTQVLENRVLGSEQTGTFTFTSSIEVNQTSSQNDPTDIHLSKDVKEIRKSPEKTYATKGTTVSYAPMVESEKYKSAEDRKDRSINDDQPAEKRQKKSSGKSFSGMRKLFSGASTRNRNDDHKGRKANNDSIISAKISSVASVNDNENEDGGRNSNCRIKKELRKSNVKISENLAREVLLVSNLAMKSDVVINKVEVNHSGFKSMENVVRDQIVIRPGNQMDMNNLFDMEKKASQRSNATKRNSLLSIAKSYIRRRSEIETEETEAVKRRNESSKDSITLSTEDGRGILKEEGVAKTESLFSRGMRRLFKKRSSAAYSVPPNNNSARDSTDDLNQSRDVQNLAKPAKEKFDVEQLMYSVTTESPWKNLETNKSKSTVPLLRSMEESDELPKARSKSQNRSTISDDDYDIEAPSANMIIPEIYTEIRFMEQDESGKKTDSNRDDNVAQKQRWSEISSNNDFKPIPSFAGRRSTIVMMAQPMLPREEEAQPEKSSSSTQTRDESSSTPTAFYYLLGPSLDEALIDIRVIFQNLIDKIIGRGR